MAANPTSGRFSTTDLALLQPTAVPAPALPWSPAEPATVPPNREPLDERRLLSALRGRPAARFLVRLRLAADAVGRATTWPRLLVFPFLAVPLLAVPWVFGQFGTRNNATATAAMVLDMAVVHYLGTRLHVWRRRTGRVDDLAGVGDTALIVAYLERAGPAGEGARIDKGLESGADGKGDVPGSPLLEHKEGDPMCPCPRETCAGDLASAPLWSSSARNLITLLLSFMAIRNFLIFFTPFVTLGFETWTHAWSAAVATLCLFNSCICHWIPMFGLLYGYAQPRAVALEARLQVRATALAMSDLVSHLRRLADASSPPTDLPADASDMQYIVLHNLLAPAWQRRFHSHRILQSSRAWAIVSGLVSGVIYAAGSFCIPAWVLANIVYYFAFIVDDLLAIARFNDGVGAVLDLFRHARAEIRRLRALAPSGPATDALAAHDLVLSGFLEADRDRAAFLGVRVDYGVVRVVVLSMLTVVGVVWGVLWGVGVAVTLESVCSGGGG
ncbi:hypothetical protein DFJ74DRAFT_718626 [Hyaloraphidium curvatum]|nr:hypothetical protein DFJ74DRAFT_718626 [Hyaloraphidium curvatum]